MDTRQLKHFVALYEMGSAHAAAENQNISQPGLSSSIKRLEDVLGTPLFTRDGRRLLPNDKGRLFYTHAKHILKQTRLAQAELDTALSRVVIGVGDIRGSNFVAALSSGLKQKFPKLELEFFESEYEALYDKLEKGDVDAAFVGIPIDSVPPSLISETLIRSKFVVVCAPDHPLVKLKGPVSVSDLESYPWMLNTAANVRTPTLPYFNNKTRMSKADTSFIRVDSLRMGIELVVNSDCLGHLPELAVRVELEQGKLVMLDLPLRTLNNTIVGLRHRETDSAIIDATFKIVEDYFNSGEMAG